jgi:hypothetical protein
LDSIFGLPVHPLLVHATVVVLPLAALAVGLAALWPAFRRRAGAAPVALSVVALVLVPLSVQSGKALGDRVEETALVDTHRGLGEDMLAWTIGLTLAAFALYWLRRKERHPDRSEPPASVSRPLTLAVALVALTAAVGTTVHVVRVGHSGSEAAWSDVPEARP